MFDMTQEQLCFSFLMIGDLFFRVINAKSVYIQLLILVYFHQRKSSFAKKKKKKKKPYPKVMVEK